MKVGSSTPNRRDSWAIARTAIVLAGLGFAAASLAVACLDHYDESWGCPKAPDGGVDCDGGTTEVDATVPSGSGSGAI